MNGPLDTACTCNGPAGAPHEQGCPTQTPDAFWQSRGEADNPGTWRLHGLVCPHGYAVKRAAVIDPNGLLRVPIDDCPVAIGRRVAEDAAP